MRIPQYSEQISADRIRLNTPQVSAVNLSSAIDAVERQAGIAMDAQRKAYETFVLAESQRTGFELDKKYAEIQEKIKNGGSYASAEKEWSDYHQKITKDSLSRFGKDEDTRTRVGLGYEKSGVEYGLRIRNSVRERIKSDAVNSFNNRVEGWKQRYVFSNSYAEKQLIIDEFTNGVSGLENSGAIKQGSGEKRVRNFVADLKGMELAQIHQELGPKGAISFLEREREVFPAEYYVQNKIRLQDELQALETKEKALEDYNKSVSSGIPAKQQNVNVAFEEFLKNPENNTPENITSFINVSGKVPEQFKNQANIYLSSDMTNASDEEILSVYNTALSVVEIQKNPAIKNLESSFSKDTELVASSIVDRVAAGVPVATAVKESTKIASDPDYFKRFKSARQDAIKSLQSDISVIRTPTGKVKGGIFGAQDFDPTVVSDYADIYARKKAMFSSDEEAEKAARKEIFSTYDEYNGVTVKQPPHLMFPQYEKKSWEKIGLDLQKNLQDKNKIGKTDRVVLVSGAATHAMIQQLKESEGAVSPDKVPFYVTVNNGNGSFWPVHEEVEINGVKTMRPKVVYADPKISFKKVREYESIKEGF